MDDQKDTLQNSIHNNNLHSKKFFWTTSCQKNCSEHQFLKNIIFWQLQQIWFDIYPSRRHNLPLTLEIIIQKFPKKSEIFHNFPKFAKCSKFSQNFHWLVVYNIKHNLARSYFQLWLKSATRVTKSREKTGFFLENYVL